MDCARHPRHTGRFSRRPAIPTRAFSGGESVAGRMDGTRDGRVEVCADSCGSRHTDSADIPDLRQLSFDERLRARTLDGMCGSCAAHPERQRPAPLAAIRRLCGTRAAEQALDAFLRVWHYCRTLPYPGPTGALQQVVLAWGNDRACTVLAEFVMGIARGLADHC